MSYPPTSDIEDDKDKDDLNLEYLDVDAQPAKLKPKPQELTYEDFKKEFGLDCDGINAHRLTEKDVTDERCAALFGKRHGARGRAGFKWEGLKRRDVQARVREIHWKIYQHPQNTMPSFLKIQFARGIVQETDFGKGTIDWEKNENQRSRVRKIWEKLLYCKKFGLPPTTETWKRLKKEKVDIAVALGVGTPRTTPGTSQKVRVHPSTLLFGF